jgi:hypothetical protein
VELAGLLEAGGLAESWVDGVPMGLRPGIAPVGSEGSRRVGASHRVGAREENRMAEKAMECWPPRIMRKHEQSHEGSHRRNHELNRGQNREQSHEQNHGQSHDESREENRQDRRQRCHRLGLGPQRAVRWLDSCFV